MADQEVVQTFARYRHSIKTDGAKISQCDIVETRREIRGWLVVI